MRRHKKNEYMYALFVCAYSYALSLLSFNSSLLLLFVLVSLVQTSF